MMALAGHSSKGLGKLSVQPGLRMKMKFSRQSQRPYLSPMGPAGGPPLRKSGKEKIVHWGAHSVLGSVLFLARPQSAHL